MKASPTVPRNPIAYREAREHRTWPEYSERRKEHDNWHHLAAEAALRMFDVDPRVGLMAEDAASRRPKSGINRIAQRPRPGFTAGFFASRCTFVGSAAVLLAQLLFTCSPVTDRLFHAAPISAALWLGILGVAAVVLTGVEIEKWLRCGPGRRNHVLPE